SDIAITDTEGLVLSHSDQSFLGKTIERRENFSNLVNAGVWRQVKLIFGPYRVYEYRSGISRQDGTPFGEVRVGIPTIFLRNDIRTSVRKAAVFSGAAILFSLLIAAVVSTVALRPL